MNLLWVVVGDDRRFRVTVLGCSGSYPGPGVPSSGYLLRGAGATVWLDAGSGTFANLQQHVAVEDLDAVVLTHSHVDHWIDLSVLATKLRYHSDRGPLPVYGTAETCELADHLLAGSVRETFAWHDVSDGSAFRVGDLDLRCSRTHHPPETIGVRADSPNGRSLAYSADTGPEWSPAALGDDIDLFLCEATFGVEHEGSYPHLSGRQAGAMAHAAGVAGLVLTHIEPGRDPLTQKADAAAAYGGPVALASVGATFDI